MDQKNATAKGRMGGCYVTGGSGDCNVVGGEDTGWKRVTQELSPKCRIGLERKQKGQTVWRKEQTNKYLDKTQAGRLALDTPTFPPPRLLLILTRSME